MQISSMNNTNSCPTCRGALQWPHYLLTYALPSLPAQTLKTMHLHQLSKLIFSQVLCFCLPFSVVKAEINLPIEIFGQNRLGQDPAIIRDATVNVPTGSDTRAIEFRIHSPGYPGKVSIALNGGNFETLGNNNPKLQIEEGAKVYGGIGSIWQTIRMTITVPAGLGQDGTNTIRFRYNGTRGRTMGFRVLSFNLLDSNGTRLIPMSEFRQEDPAAWQPPIPGATAISEGRQLWETANLRKSPGGLPIKAKCAMCHTPSGSDLKYFNYSNHSIIERSKFHGLSEEEGRKIASYIRAADIVAPGRPWNPPYQPGPGLDSLPGSHWAAGAGVDWAIPDELVQQYLPGNGTDLSAHMDSNRRYYAYNKREIPIKTQFVDWNQWLPEDHPVDLFGEAWHQSSKVKTDYDEIRMGLLGQLGMSKDEYVSGKMREDIRNWVGNEAYSRFGENGWFDQGNRHRSQNIMGTQLTALVRLWGLLHEFDLHDLGEQWYGLQGEKRLFPSYRTIFNTAPHILGTNNASNGTPDRTFRTVVDDSLPWHRDWDSGSDNWYQMQVILNGGQRNSFRGGHHVVDWKYITYFANAGAGRTSWNDRYDDANLKGSPMYALSMGWKSLQEGDTAFGPDGAGTSSSTTNRWWGTALRESRPSIANLFTDPFNGMSKPEIAAILEPIYIAFVTNFCTHTLEQWAVNGDEYGGDRDYTIGVDSSQDKYIPTFAREAQRMRDDFDVSHAVVNAMMDMGAFKWPGRNNANISVWNASRAPVDRGIPIPQSVQVDSLPGHMMVSWTPVPGATSYNVYRTRVSDGHALPSGLLIKGTSFKEPKTKAGEQLRFSVSANVGRNVGNRSQSVQATGAEGLVLHYTFNRDGATHVEDSSGNEFWGKLISGAKRVPGASGGGIRLSGNAGYRNSSFISSSQNLSQWINRSTTVSLRVKRFGTGTSTNPDSSVALIGSTRGGANAATVTLGALDPTGRLMVRYYKGNTVSSNIPMKMGGWQHVAISRQENTGEVKIYFDGNLVGSGNSTQGYQIARAFGIGRADNFAPDNAAQFFRYFPGEIDDVRIYNRVLSSPEISALTTTPEGDLTVSSLTSSYNEWANMVDWDNHPASAQSADADPDGDGRSNMIERAFGTDPTTADAGSHLQMVPVPDKEAGKLKIQYKKHAADMVYDVVHHPSLGDWHHWTPIDTAAETWNAATSRYEIDWQPGFAEPRQFFSLRVRPAP